MSLIDALYIRFIFALLVLLLLLNAMKCTKNIETTFRLFIKVRLLQESYIEICCLVFSTGLTGLACEPLFEAFADFCFFVSATHYCYHCYSTQFSLNMFIFDIFNKFEYVIFESIYHFMSHIYHLINTFLKMC